MVVTWSRKSSLAPAKIAFFVCLVLLKDEGRKVSPIFHLFVSDINQMRRRDEFKVHLRDPSNGKILPRSSTS